MTTKIHGLIRIAMLPMFLLSAAWQLEAATPVLLIGPDLKPRLVNLQAMGGGRMTFFDAQRNMQVQSTSDVLQIRFPVQTPAETASSLQDMTDIITDPGALPREGVEKKVSPAFVELIDGQRVFAVFESTDDAGQQLRFKHPVIGEITLPLDKVARLAFDGSSQPQPTPTSDQVILINGDVLSGFVVSIKAAGIEVQQGEAKPFTLPRDRVKAIHLANPVSRAVTNTSMIWLRDGSRLLASEVSISADKLAMLSPLTGKEAVTLELKQLARIELASPSGQLIDLADLPMSVTAGGNVFGLAMKPRTQGSTIQLHAPITVSFALPAKATRFAAVAQLDVTGENADLAHFIINITTSNSPAARHVISSREPRADINAPLSGSSLIIDLDPAINGPVLDRLKLSDAVIFIER